MSEANSNAVLLKQFQGYAGILSEQLKRIGVKNGTSVSVEVEGVKPVFTAETVEARDKIVSFAEGLPVGSPLHDNFEHHRAEVGVRDTAERTPLYAAPVP